MARSMAKPFWWAYSVQTPAIRLASSNVKTFFDGNSIFPAPRARQGPLANVGRDRYPCSLSNENSTGRWCIRMRADELYWDPYDYDLHRDPHPVWGTMMA